MGFKSIAPSKEFSSSSLAELAKNVTDLAQWAYYEFNAVQAAFQSTEANKIWTTVPPKPREGTYAYADGVHWNPGASEGPYYYNSLGLWVPMGVNSLTVAPFLRSYLAGFNVSVSGATVTVTPGVAANSTNTDMIQLTASMSKTTAAWAPGSGNGGLDTGTIASGGYHLYVIRNNVTGAVDLTFSLSATGPALSGGFNEWRRIWWLSYVSPNWYPFSQNGDECLWITPVNDANAVATGARTDLVACAVPTGIEVWAQVNVLLGYQTAAVTMVVYGPDSGPQVSGTPIGNYNITSGVSQIGALDKVIRTNTSGQIAINMAGAGSAYYVVTKGYFDRRGRDA